VRNLAILALLLSVTGCVQSTHSRQYESWVDIEGKRHPRPVGMDEQVEKTGGAARRRWREAMHVAPPGVDWRAIELENQRVEMERRNQLGLAPDLTAQRWTEVGSKNQSGRVHTAALGAGSTSAGKVYAGTDLGGVWRANADGSGWEPLSDNRYGGVHQMVVGPGENPGDPDLMLVSTDSGSLHVSRNDGQNWETPAGLPTITGVRGLAQLQDASRTLLALVIISNGGGRARLYASTDYGRTFQLRWTAPSAYPAAMWVPRKGASAATHVYLVQNGVLYTSVNGGASFTAGGTIDAGSDRAVLAGSEAGAPTLYAAVRNANAWKLYRSNDAGASFTLVQTLSDFFETLDASSVDPNRVVYGGVEIFRSFNGGTTFTKFNGWGEYYGNPATKLHADSFGIRIVPLLDSPIDNERWYIGTDGGLYVSEDLGGTVRNLSLTGMGIGQYYSTLTSKSAPQLLLAGSQDQGYQRGSWTPWSQGPSTDFAQLISGDYGHLTSCDGSHNLVYSTYPGFILVSEGQNNPALYYPSFPSGSSQLWLPPVMADPLSATSFFFLGNQLWRYTRTSTSVWTPTVHTTFNFLATGGSYLSAMAFAPSDAQRCYAVTDNGRLFYSTNHGTNWTAASGSGPGSHYFYGNALAVHPSISTEACVGGSGYGLAGVWRTVNGGASWSPLGSGLPQTMVYDIAYAENGSGDLYAATEAGPWWWQRSTNIWNNLQSLGSPMTVWWSVESVNYGQSMRFGSYGRGIWDYAIPAGNGPQWQSYGASLPAPHVLTLFSAQLPRLGQEVSFTVQHPAAGARTGWIFFSSSPGSQPVFGGHVLLGAIQGLQRVALNASGQGSARFTFPNDIALLDQSIYFQALVNDSAQGGGYAFSNGLQAVLGL
jgi:photosystem II stability/assembly factor-like uncharacterized protein